MHRAGLHFAGTHPIVQCVSSGVFILSQKVQVEPRYTDTLRVRWRAKPSQSPFHIGEDFLSLMFRRFCERGKWLDLTLHGSRADFIESAVPSHRAEQIGIRCLLERLDKIALRHRSHHSQLLLRLKERNHRERRPLAGGDGTRGPVRSKLIEPPVKADHLTIEIIESAK